ncbi:MAG: 2Fe-2S iron-sulfur cluster-binding protein [Alphaproteobacteria bacterium]|nr:2Fe-2S iron-sulfur cluster-binding protein [Alphaproteobacteria bacterium]
MSAPTFHELAVVAVDPEAAQSVAITLAVPESLRAVFAFEPGQFITLRAKINGQDVRRNYSLCSTPIQFERNHTLQVGVRAVEGGLMSTWLQGLRPGQSLQVAPPEGCFVIRRRRALHRVGFAAGSGITPILSVLTHTLESSPQAKFTLVYGNRRTDSVMFNEALQDLKDRFPDRLTLVHILSRQAQEVPLLEGRIDAEKVRALMDVFLPVKSMDEVFICGPEAMIEATETSLLAAGVPADRVHTERFASAGSAPAPVRVRRAGEEPALGIKLSVIADGKRHELRMSEEQRILDVALEAGLDLPYSCKGGVCCTCRAKLMSGEVRMDKNFTLENDEVRQGFVLSCQARPTTTEVVVSFDER